MKPSKQLRLRTERLAELDTETLAEVAGLSGWDTCGWPVNSLRTCWSVCELTCVVC